MADSAYADATYQGCEVAHLYGDGVHIVQDPAALSMLARLCSDDCRQPEISRLVRILYRVLIHEVVNQRFPRTAARVPTRMQALTPRGCFEGMLIDRSTPTVSVDVARAGMLPSQACYEYLNEVLDPSVVRQDHLVMSRVTDDDHRVTGARINGDKVGGPIDGRIVLFPDPMGATGSSLSKAITYLKDEFGRSPAQLITLNLIVTPEFIRRLRHDHPEVQVFALRLDRGMSADDVLAAVPGARWDEESGLTETDYIVPGAGGFGEIMNNAFV
jgi:uracil phosphoribosyltransferase